MTDSTSGIFTSDSKTLFEVAEKALKDNGVTEYFLMFASESPDLQENAGEPYLDKARKAVATVKDALGALGALGDSTKRSITIDVNAGKAHKTIADLAVFNLVLFSVFDSTDKYANAVFDLTGVVDATAKGKDINFTKVAVESIRLLFTHAKLTDIPLSVTIKGIDKATNNVAGYDQLFYPMIIGHSLYSNFLRRGHTYIKVAVTDAAPDDHPIKFEIMATKT